jgi:hypothetical protein
MFRYTDPSAIAARIKDIRPDADPEAVAYATEQLYKMSSGNLREQLAAANMYKYLRGENWQREKFAAQLPLKQADLTIKKGNLTERQKTQSRLSAQFGEKVQQFTSKLAEARAKTSAQDRRGALEGLRKNIEKQLYPPFGTPGPTEEEKPVLQRQLNEVVNEMRKSAGMKPLPTPGAPAQPPSE